MNLIRVRPTTRNYRRPLGFHTEFDRLFDHFFTDEPKAVKQNNHLLQFRPAVNTAETAEDYRLEIAAPGLEKTDFTVKVEKDLLSITVKKEVKEEEGVKVRKREFGSYEFNRTFRLSDKIDQEGITAGYKNGILLVVLPKKAEAKELPPRSIEVG